MPRSITGTPPRRRRTAPAVGLLTMSAVAAALALGGCSAGQVTSTDTQVAPVPGTDATIDLGGGQSISLQNLTLAYPGPQGYAKGSSAPLIMRIFNNSTQDVTLTGVRTTAADRVALVGGSASATPSATALPSASASTSASPSAGASGAAASPSTSAQASASASATPSGSASATPSGSASASTSASASASASASPSPSGPSGSSTISVQIPAGGYVVLAPNSGQYLQVVGLQPKQVAGLQPENGPLFAGATIPLTFTFSAGDPTTVQVPVGVPTSPASRAPGEHAGEGSE